MGRDAQLRLSVAVRLFFVNSSGEDATGGFTTDELPVSLPHRAVGPCYNFGSPLGVTIEESNGGEFLLWQASRSVRYRVMVGGLSCSLWVLRPLRRDRRNTRQGMSWFTKQLERPPRHRP